ncbi:hypothetical protein [Streptomyces sparsogenes]|uniref:Uncharacterized protein n=1 Tax=Streptomyces sparsogenes DSM 40356 TaxID=1331668 RepID=A0A1R1S7G8_9ACTN|nr:hypothetical protein [Streptomyces sparsogenes]OMI34173.1 hypothetical protein SPAR_37703 [Streptomyces sparsogenes DSM 40356]
MKSQPLADGHAAPSRRARRRVRTASDTASDGPVFVDSSGRRARLLRRAGVLAGIAFLGYTMVLALAFMGGTPFAPETLIPGKTGASGEKEQSNKGGAGKGNSASSSPTGGGSASESGGFATGPAVRPSFARKHAATTGGRTSAPASATTAVSSRASTPSRTPSASSWASSSGVSSASSKPTPSASAPADDTATASPEGQDDGGWRSGAADTGSSDESWDAG